MRKYYVLKKSQSFEPHTVTQSLIQQFSQKSIALSPQMKEQSESKLRSIANTYFPSKKICVNEIQEKTMDLTPTLPKIRKSSIKINAIQELKSLRNIQSTSIDRQQDLQPTSSYHWQLDEESAHAEYERKVQQQCMQQTREISQNNYYDHISAEFKNYISDVQSLQQQIFLSQNYSEKQHSTVKIDALKEFMIQNMKDILNRSLNDKINSLKRKIDQKQLNYILIFMKDYFLKQYLELLQVKRSQVCYNIKSYEEITTVTRINKTDSTADIKANIFELNYSSIQAQKILSSVLLEQNQINNEEADKIQNQVKFEEIFRDLIKPLKSNAVLLKIVDYLNEIRHYWNTKLIDSSQINISINSTKEIILKLSTGNCTIINQILKIVMEKRNYGQSKIIKMQILLQEEQILQEMTNISQNLSEVIQIFESLPERNIKEIIQYIFETEFDKIAMHIRNNQNQSCDQELVSYVSHPLYTQYVQQLLTMLQNHKNADSSVLQQAEQQHIEKFKQTYIDELTSYIEKQRKQLLKHNYKFNFKEAQIVLDQLQQQFLQQFSKQDIQVSSFYDFNVVNLKYLCCANQSDETDIINQQIMLIDMTITQLQTLKTEQTKLNNPLIYQIEFAIEMETLFKQSLHQNISKLSKILLIKCIIDLRSQICMCLIDNQIVESSQIKTKQLLQQISKQTIEKITDYQNILQQQNEESVSKINEMMQIEIDFNQIIDNIPLDQVLEVANAYLDERLQRLDEASKILKEVI
ncbi:Hypothetical_protein [Hexamita inflata]|uniref:Hypothetical_protein n=1 Tax=Hexamita inflata TaxID=28002 RepID=A0AA86QXV7_9EUKA|nr:Hypothetical protein HINF_LOCUS41767 [Hexamita inflata]CAI9963291.1 Hypothetical protein HINF_LOCUS50936 [Hexamita inflata]